MTPIPRAAMQQRRKQRKAAVTAWSTPGRRERSCVLANIEPFVARGMKPVYGRGDHFSGHAAFHMGVWRTASGRILARFWSRSGDVEWLSYEIVGLSIPGGRIAALPADNEYLIPQCLRDAYDDWIISGI